MSNATEPLKSFSEEAFFSAYKSIRNQFRKYLPSTIVVMALDYLQAPVSKPVGDLQKHPWLVFLLLKWVLIDEQFNYPNKQQITKQKFQALLADMQGLGSDSTARMPNEYAHHRLWLRNISYQQFFYQAEFNGPAFARQSLLFDKLPSNHAFRVEFEKITDIPLSDFFELSTMLLARVMFDQNKPISLSWFSSVSHRYNKSTIQKFIDLLSRDLNSLRRHLLSGTNPKNRKSSELYEESPLVKFPLLKNDNQYYLWHPMLFNRCLEFFVYDTLRSSNSKWFMNKFGNIFENYVQSSIDYLGLPYLNEQQIKSTLIGNGKVTDFLITEDGANVFVDAKGVEMAYLGKVSHLPEVILDKAETSALKGIEQGFEMVKRLSAQKTLNSEFQSTQENYLLVITFKELYLGNGKDFYDAIAKSKIDALLFNNTPPIPLENIYFLTIDDFDRFSNSVNKGEVKFVEFIRKVVNEDSSIKTKKFHFRQHLSEIGTNIGLSKYLDDEINNIFDRVNVYFNYS